MKLLRRYNNWFLKITAMLLVVGCLVIFFTFKYLFTDEINEQMQFQKAQLLSESYTIINPPTQAPIEGIFTELVATKGIDIIKNVEYLDKVEHENVPFTEYVFYKPLQNQFIKFTIRKSTIEEEDLLYTLITVIIFIFILFCIILYFLNRKVSANLFSPFFNTIEKIKQHQTFANKPLQLPKTRIEEFTLLNEALNNFDNNLRNEYKKVSQFTDNASHELQTPIAIISNRIESILENSANDDEIKKELAEIFETVQQMKKTNETLLLLSRLNNNNFKNEVECDLTEIISSKIENYLQFGFFSDLKIEAYYSSFLIKGMNNELANILVDNILTNAIKHNINNGFIDVVMSANAMVVKNSGLPLQKPAIEMFNRFERNNDIANGTGLGLSIVQEICSLYNLTVSYTEANGIHTITILK